jgi:hypothetical protein
MRMNLRRKPTSLDTSTERSTEGGSPRQQFLLQSAFNLPGGMEFDWNFRLVSELASQGIPRYATSNVRLGWRVTNHLDFSVAGQNLHESQHAEFGGGVLIERGAYGKLTLHY